MKNFIKSSIALSTLTLTATFANAAPIVYTSEASWLSALSGATLATEDFSASPAVH